MALTDRPPPAVPYWTRARAVAQIRRVLDGAPAGPERQDARLALTWLDARLAELERAVRAEDTTARVETPPPSRAVQPGDDVAHRGPGRRVP